MSIRTKVLGLVDIIMRVPPIMVIDELLKVGLGLPSRFSSSETVGSGNELPTISANTVAQLNVAISTNSVVNAPPIVEEAIKNATVIASTSGVISNSLNDIMDALSQDSDLIGMVGVASVRLLLCVLGLLVASWVFLLWTRHLVMVYMFVISLFITFLSYWSNTAAVELLQQNSGCLMEDLLSLNRTRIEDTAGVVISIAPHFIAQWMMGIFFAYMHLGPRYTALQKPMPIIFVSPILLAMLPLPSTIVRNAPIAAKLVPLVLIKITAMCSAVEVGKTLYNGYLYGMNFVASFGLSALVENEWQRLNVPNVLRVFWTMRIVQQFFSLARTQGLTNMEFMPTAQQLLVDGCDTLTAVLGMTAVISLVCHYIGRLFQWYLLRSEYDEEKSLGTVSAVLFYVLALQTGLTSLAPEKRFVRLCRNLCLLVTALLHFLHNIVSPILMSLSAARNPSVKRHVRALSVCAFLVIAPICLLTALWSRYTPSTWLLAVTAFSAEIIVKVFVSLATYSLFIIDARRQSFWERLDDYLYYVRSFGNTVEFCFGIFLFFNGAWILFFESEQNASGGAIRAIMMCIHAYFNIWCEARAGWSVFMKRRSAVTKISSLPEATSAQLRAFDDVCAICYQEMNSAKITRCRHFFHGVCLRKWLYVQDRCPLCHEIMMNTDRLEENSNNVAQAAAPEIVAQVNTERVTNLRGNSNSTDEPSIVHNSTSQTADFATATTTAAAANATEVESTTSSTTTTPTSNSASVGNPANSFRIATNIGTQR